MIFSKDLLFIHIPKTGGMSVAQYLMEVLPRPVYYAHPDFDESLDSKGVAQIAGKRHETVEEAQDIVRQYGFDVREFPAIIAVLRNPYSLEVSRYSYLQAGYAWDKGPNQDLALTRDFETFARLSTYHGGATRSIEQYLLLDGALPERLKILRFETLVDDFRACLNALGLPSGGDFPWKNKSPHLDYRAYYTEEAEEAVFHRYRWVFENGYYERMTADDLQIGRQEALKQSLPLDGPVSQIGPALGFGSHNWVERVFRFTLEAEQGISGITLSGVAPAEIGDVLHASVVVDDRVFEETFRTRERFHWQIPCDLAPGRRAHLKVVSDPSWRPADSGTSEDRRRLAFQLREIRAVTGAAPGDGKSASVRRARSEAETLATQIESQS